MLTNGNASDDMDNIENLESRVKSAEEDFYVTALHSTDRMKCSVNFASTVLERNMRQLSSLENSLENSVDNSIENSQENRDLAIKQVDCKTNVNIKGHNKGNNIENDDFDIIKSEFARLNSNLFKSLEVHSKSIRRNLLQMNNLIDQHNLQLMPYNSLKRRLKERNNE
eukprot:GFUD01009265.1.p1 GENE.GFUD01009265.1~~GFUD01009265.1.p1  ORF type:complete len:168 (+),score=60.30 GFUD01009265.1:79-582(+)